MKKGLVLLYILLSLALTAGAEGFGVGVNYGLINNFKMFDAASTEAGTMLQVSYSYHFNDLYTAALEVGFIMDNNVLGSAAGTPYVETGSYLNIDHLFYLKRTEKIASYLSVGTGLMAVTGWWKTGAGLVNNATYVFADLNVGAGADIKIGNGICNLALNIPGLGHELYHRSNVAYILSLGYKQPF